MPASSALTSTGVPRDDIGKGIAYVCAATLVFSGFNVIVKYLSDLYPIAELVFFRSFFALVPCVYLVWRAGGMAALRTTRPFAHLVRASIWLTSFLCSFASLHLLPLADAVAFSFAAPLFVTALSVPILKERVGPYRWGAVIVGFLGVLVMAHPSGDILKWGAFFGVGNALFFALGSLSVRQLSRTESSVSIVAYTQLFASILSGLATPFSWVTPSPHHAAAMVATGIAGGIAQYWMTQSYRFAPAVVVAPFTYTAIVWATIFGYLVWSDLPTSDVLVGAVIVIASGLFILYRETKRAAEAAAAT